MPRAWSKRRRITTTADVAVTTTVDTIVATLTGISTDRADARVDINAWIQLSPGAAATAATLTIRRTNAAGALVGEANSVVVVAANQIAIGISVQDMPGEVTNQTYVLLVQQAAATADGSVRQSEIEAIY